MSETIRIDGFGDLGVTRIAGVPVPVFIFIAVVIAFVVLLRYTTYGRAMYATGASPTAARLAGIRTSRNIFIAFLLSSALAGLSGLILLSQVGGASVVADQGLELAVVTAVVLGGTRILGGSGRYVGTVVGVVLIVLLNSVLSIMQMPEAGRQVIYGSVIIAMLLVYGRSEKVTS